MRAVLPIAVLLAFLTLGVGAALWLWSQDGAPAGPVARTAPEAIAEPTAGPGVVVDPPRERAEAVEVRSAAAVVEAPAPAPQSGGDAAVAGWLRVEGRAPGEVVALQLGSPLVNGGRSIDHRTRASLDGAFRFEGVADDWMGAVVLPDHYRLERPDEHGGDAHVVPARANQLDLVLDVVRLPLLRGRVLAADGTPVPEAYVLVHADLPNASSIWSVRADAQGRFERMLRTHELLNVALACRSEDGGAFQREWTAETLPRLDERGDLDLGDLLLVPSESAEVLVLDPEGAPFEGASVIEVAQTGTRPIETGPDGIARVQLAANVEGYEVHAVGHSLVALPRPLPGERLVARLTATSVLSIELLDARGEAWPHGQLRLRAERPAFEGGRDQPSFPGPDAGVFFEFGRDREGAYALCRVGPEARVEWPGIEPGVALELSLEDVVGTRGAHVRIPGLAAGERRAVRLQLTREPRRLTGSCVDATGSGVVEAQVRMRVPEARSTEVKTAEDGSFASPPLLADRVDVRVNAVGFAGRSVQDVALPAELRLVLARGRTLRVTLRDTWGDPFEFGQLRAHADESTWSATRVHSGSHTFEDVADAGLELVHSLHGRSHTSSVPDGVESFTWELPALGRLEVEVAQFGIAELESAYVVLEALDGRGGVEQRFLEPGTPWTLRFDPWPGPYRLRRVVHAFAADADGWRTPAGTREVGVAVEVEVASDRVAHAVLEETP